LRCETRPRFLYALDDLGTLAVELVGISGVRLLLAVLQPRTGVSLQHSVFRAVVSIAKTAVTDDPLCGFLALLEIAARLARRHVVRKLRQELGKVV
jgi:hypothetical protein